MKKVFKKFSIIIVCIMMFFAVFVPNSFANECPNYENEIIGGANISNTPKTRANLLPNLLKIDFDATSTSVILKFTNIAVDSIDIVTANVTIGSLTKTVTFSKVKPGTTLKTVNINMRKCHENISVYTVASDGGDSIGSITTTGKRTIPSVLLDTWHQGSFPSASDSLNYHFGVHGYSVGTYNIVSYVQSAKNFQFNLSGASSSRVIGATPNVTRWRKNGKYIDICGGKNTGKIASYGRQ